MRRALRIFALLSAACTTAPQQAVSDGGSGTDAGPPIFSDACAVTSVAHCSDDLHSYIDGCGNVLLTCPPDQGCAPGGTCLAACDAANANQSSVGCEYYAVKPSDFGAASCFAAFVANTWTSAVHVSVDRGGTPLNDIGYTVSGSGASVTYAPLVGNAVPAGAVAVFFMESGPRPPTQGEVQAVCPPSVNVGVEPDQSSQEGTGRYAAFHIQTDVPVVAYDMGPYGGGSSAFAGSTLLLPTSVWSGNYVATSGWSTELADEYDPWIGFVGSQDNTTLTILPTADIVAGPGVSGATKNQPTTYTLQRGELLRFYQTDDLSGSVVSADKPVGSWAGHGCTDIGDGACDAIHMQIPPVQALGSEYVAVRYRNRHDNWDETPPWRFVGVVDGTMLSFDPPQTGAPTTLARGQILELASAGPFVVTSQDASHPFFLAAHMTGAANYPYSSSSGSKDGGTSNGADGVGFAGDPETVGVIPPAQYLARYVLFTDPTYPETNLVFVRTKAGDGTFHDVTLDCAGVLGSWQPIGTSSRYEYTRADVQTGNFGMVGACDNGRHEATSDVPFALTVWGWGTAATTTFTQYVSYGYAAGMSIKPINNIIVSPTPN
jgi:IgGFc binding protein